MSDTNEKKYTVSLNVQDEDGKTDMELFYGGSMDDGSPSWVMPKEKAVSMTYDDASEKQCKLIEKYGDDEKGRSHYGNKHRYYFYVEKTPSPRWTVVMYDTKKEMYIVSVGDGTFSLKRSEALTWDSEDRATEVMKGMQETCMYDDFKLRVVQMIECNTRYE